LQEINFGRKIQAYQAVDNAGNHQIHINQGWHLSNPKGENMKNIPENFQDLFADETQAFLFLATTMEDGSPQVTPVWFNTDGTYVLINSAKGRTKDRNMRARPRVAAAIMDPKNSYRYIQLRGNLVEITEEGARDHINALAKKYMGQDVYPGPPDETRVTYKIEIEKSNTMG